MAASKWPRKILREIRNRSVATQKAQPEICLHREDHDCEAGAHSSRPPSPKAVDKIQAAVAPRISTSIQLVSLQVFKNRSEATGKNVLDGVIGSTGITANADVVAIIDTRRGGG